MEARHRNNTIYIMVVLIGEKKVNRGKMIYEKHK